MAQDAAKAVQLARDAASVLTSINSEVQAPSPLARFTQRQRAEMASKKALDTAKIAREALAILNNSTDPSVKLRSRKLLRIGSQCYVDDGEMGDGGDSGGSITETIDPLEFSPSSDGIVKPSTKTEVRRIFNLLFSFFLCFFFANVEYG